MYRGFQPFVPFVTGNKTYGFNGVGVGLATLDMVGKLSGAGTLTGEGIASLVGSIGKVGTFATAVGEGYVDPPLFNQFNPDFGDVVGEGISQSMIGIGSILAIYDEQILVTKQAKSLNYRGSNIKSRLGNPDVEVWVPTPDFDHDESSVLNEGVINEFVFNGDSEDDEE